MWRPSREPACCIQGAASERRGACSCGWRAATGAPDAVPVCQPASLPACSPLCTGAAAACFRTPNAPPPAPAPRPCSAPGERLQAKLGSGDKSGLSEGVTGLKSGPARTGVRELTYRLVFIASGTQVGRGDAAALGCCKAAAAWGIAVALSSWRCRAGAATLLPCCHARTGTCLPPAAAAGPAGAAPSRPPPRRTSPALCRCRCRCRCSAPVCVVCCAAAGPEERHGEHPGGRGPGAGGRAGPVLAGAAGAGRAAWPGCCRGATAGCCAGSAGFSLGQRVRGAQHGLHLLALLVAPLAAATRGMGRPPGHALLPSLLMRAAAALPLLPLLPFPACRSSWRRCGRMPHCTTKWRPPSRPT